MKYMGSKNRIAKHILPFIKEHLNGNNLFVDVFCGGCNLIDKLDYPMRLANDSNKYLIAMWRELVGGVKPPLVINRDYYNSVRDSFNNNNDNYIDFDKGWVGFMGSYNGRFFDGGYSGHNVAIKNGYRDYIGEGIRQILEQVPKLKGVGFMCGSYDREMALPPNSVIYCDPPYKNTKQYGNSKDFDHASFWQWCRDMTIQGHKVFVSEYNAPDDFKCVWEMEVTNSLSTKNTYRPTEKLFTL